MRKSLTIILAFAMMFSSITAYAQGLKADPIAMSEVNTYRISAPEPERMNFKQPTDLNLGSTAYIDTPVEKAGVGLINTTTSWADIPAKIAEVSERDNLFLGVTLGFGEGLVSGITRGASGVADMATFGLPPYDKPLIEPEYKVSNPNEGFKVDIFKW